MKKIIVLIAVSVIFLGVSGGLLGSVAAGKAEEKDYVQRTEKSTANEVGAKDYAEDKILDILYANNPDLEEKSEYQTYPLIQIAKMDACEETDIVRFTYFEITDVSAGELKDHADYIQFENLYQYKYGEVKMNELTDNEEVAEWLRNNLDDNVLW